MTKKARYLLPILFALPAWAATQPVASWRFEALKAIGDKGVAVREEVGGQDDAIRGNAWLVPGVVGQGLELDGITAHILRGADTAPKVLGAFTLEAWVAIGAYPFNWSPIFQQQDGEKAGYFFGVGDKGQVAFRLAVGGKWEGAETAQHVPLRQWTHLAGVYEPGRGVAIYINGRLAASQPVSGEFRSAGSADLWIGRNMYELEQTAPVSPNRQYATKILFDVILDEISISSGAKTEAEIAAYYQQHKPTTAPPLPARVLPVGPSGPARFGATYARLKYYKGWDDYWRVGDYPDVVVTFDEAPYRFIFWRGTSYIPHWVTENGIWYDNEFVETFQEELRGSAEPMSDKQCRFSHVRILESNDARVVIHWRYAPTDVNYSFAHVDPVTGWGDWTDELYFIYPDGISVRKITAHTSKPKTGREWHEGIVVMSPGTRPEDAIEPAGLTLINLDGETQTYSWEKETPPEEPAQPAGASIQLIHTRSKYKPFALARSVDKPWFDVYAGEIRRDVSMYPWWNHWPTAFEPSNGRYAQAADRASHSSLTHLHWNAYAEGKNYVTKIMLHGMTSAPAADLATMARSWGNPPKLQLTGEGFSGGDYDQTERAYVLARKDVARDTALTFRLNASKESPVHNVALVVKGWGDARADLALDGTKVPRGKDFRFGHASSPEGTDLVVWIKTQAATPIEIALSPRKL